MTGILKLLFVSAFFNALSWIIIIPVWQYPDEQAHFAQVQFISEIGNIEYSLRTLDTSAEVTLSEKILKTERDDLGNNSFTYHPEFKLPYTNSYFGVDEDKIISLPPSARKEMVKKEATVNPPLYYFIGSLAYKLAGMGDLFTRVYAVRLVSLAFFMLTIATTYLVSKLIFEKQPYLQLALTSIVATKPMLVFATTGVLPDTLTILLFSLLIFICLHVLKNGWSILKIGFLILIIILGATTRQNFLISLFILPYVIFHQFITNKKSRILTIATVTLAFVLLFIASYFVPALDFIHRLDYPESSRKIAGNPLANLTYFEHLSWTIRHSIAEVWPWYWGVYKWLSLTLPPVVYQIINRLISIAIVGIIIKAFFILKNKSYKKNIRFFFLIYIVAVYFMALTTFDFLYRKNNGFSFGIQGRYFFPVIAPTLGLILIGASNLAQTIIKNYAKFMPVVLVALFIIFNVFTLSYLASSYYETSSLATFIEHASQYKPSLLKGEIITVIFAANIFTSTLFLFSFVRFAVKTKWVNI